MPGKKSKKTAATNYATGQKVVEMGERSFSQEDADAESPIPGEENEEGEGSSSADESTDELTAPKKKPKRPKLRYPTTKDLKAMNVTKFDGEEQSPGHYGLENWILAINQAITDHKQL